jgi:hypothetical protein
MTLRLRLSRPEPGWTELFRAGPALRPMRVMADAEALHGCSDPVAGGLLAGLLRDEDIHLWRYSDDGPPAATRCVRTASGQPVAAGWALARPRRRRSRTGTRPAGPAAAPSRAQGSASGGRVSGTARCLAGPGRACSGPGAALCGQRVSQEMQWGT